MTKKKKIILITAISILLCILVIIGIVWRFNKYSLVLSVADEVITLEYGKDKVPEITALCKGSLINRKGIAVTTKMKGNVDLEKLGDYEVIFTAKYKNMTLSEKRTIKVVDTTPPEINLVSSPEHYANPVLGYEEEGFTATDNYDGDLTPQVSREEKDGKIFYTVTDSSGNTTTVERTLVYKDVIAPVITLVQGNNIARDKGGDFVEPGFSAVDECDGDLTSKVTVSGTVDGKTYGTYVLTYSVADSSGNIAEVKRTVQIADLNKPVITLHGEIKTYIKVGTAYTDPGFTASDNIDGDITSKVSVSGGVDTTRMGINTVTYTVADSFGNTTTATRKVYVYQQQAVANPINPGNKVVYLTFDDGPSAYTARLLNILDKYGVKATFFVTNQKPSYQYMIGETHRRGHTIALHTLTHNYASLYSSEEAYYQDLAGINNIVVAQTGVAPSIVRFPGGTNNTVSKNYCSGIMTALTQSISHFGYLYCDWNVSSGDAGGATTAAAVANNVISGIQRNNVSVVLQHDIKGFSVEAVDDILFWGIQNGYTFLKMDNTTPMVHFAPKN